MDSKSTKERRSRSRSPNHKRSASRSRSPVPNSAVSVLPKPPGETVSLPAIDALNQDCRGKIGIVKFNPDYKHSDPDMSSGHVFGRVVTVTKNGYVMDDYFTDDHMVIPHTLEPRFEAMPDMKVGAIGKLAYEDDGIAGTEWVQIKRLDFGDDHVNMCNFKGINLYSTGMYISSFTLATNDERVAYQEKRKAYLEKRR